MNDLSLQKTWPTNEKTHFSEGDGQIFHLLSDFYVNAYFPYFGLENILH